MTLIESVNQAALDKEYAKKIRQDKLDKENELQMLFKSASKAYDEKWFGKKQEKKRDYTGLVVLTLFIIFCWMLQYFVLLV